MWRLHVLLIQRCPSTKMHSITSHKTIICNVYFCFISLSPVRTRAFWDFLQILKEINSKCFQGTYVLLFFGVGGSYIPSVFSNRFCEQKNSWDSSDSIVARVLWDGTARNSGFIFPQNQRFFSSPQHADKALPTLILNVYGGGGE
jgi:hypothetical protein